MSGRPRGVPRRSGYSSDSDSDEDMDDVHNVFAVGTALHRAVLASVETDSGSSLDFSSEDYPDGDSPSFAYRSGGSEKRYGANLFYSPFKDGTFGEAMQHRKKQYTAPVPEIPRTFDTSELSGWHGLFVASAGHAPKEIILSASRDPSKLLTEEARTPPSADLTFPPLTQEQMGDVRQGMLHHIRDGQGHTLLMCAVGNSCNAVVDLFCQPIDLGGDRFDNTDKVAAAAMLVAKDGSGFTAAHHAAQQENAEALSSILNAICLFHDHLGKLPTDSPELMWRPPRKANTHFRVLEALLRMQPEGCHPSLLSLVALRDTLTDAVAAVMKKWGVGVSNGGAESLQKFVRDAHSHAESLWDPPLLYAATMGDIKGARHICKCLGGTNANAVACTGRAGETALHRAAVCEHEHLFEELWKFPSLKKCAAESAPSGWTQEERTALEERWQAASLVNAIFTADKPTAELLLAWDALIDVGPEEPETALHAAASAHQVSLLREILSKLGPYTPENKQLVDLLQKPDRIGLTPLHCPIHEDDKLKSRSPGNMRQCLELLIKAHQGCEVSVDQRDARSAETPLALASAADFTLVISQLHEAGADINAAARRNETPLMAAALNGSVAATQTLLKLGADVHAKTASQESVLHVVVCERLPTDKEAQIVEILLDAGADLQAVDAEGRTPIDWVASLGNPTLLKSLLQRGGTIDWSSDSGYEAFNTMFKPDQSHANDHFSLRDAQMSSELSQVAVKLAAGRDIFYLGSLVNRAIREGFHKMAGAVLEDHKQEVDEEGNTLLMCACLNSWDCLVKHLVYMPGVDIEARNKAGKNAIELAVERGEWEAFLDLYGAGATPPDTPNARLMMAATLHQWRHVEAILAELGERQERLKREADDGRLGADDDSVGLCTEDAAMDGGVQLGKRSGADQGESSGGAGSQQAGRTDNSGGNDAAPHEEANRQPPAKRHRPSEPDANAVIATGAVTGAAAGAAAAATGLDARGEWRAPYEGRPCSPPRPIVRAGTPLPSGMVGAVGTTGRSNLATGVDGASQGAGAPVALGRNSRPVGTPTRAYPVAGDLASGSLGTLRPQAATPAPPPPRLDVASLTWLIGLLMGPQELDVANPHDGQPCLMMRDRILLLLRPMMNFQEKVAYFLEELDHMLDLQMSELGDDESMHIEVHRGDEVLMDTVEQIVKAGDDSLMRELTVSFSGEEGLDGGGLLKEFCQELAVVLMKPSTAVFKEVPESSGCYQPSEQACVQADSVDVERLFWALGVVVAKAICGRACFPIPFTKSFLKQMLAEELNIDDLKDMDAELHKGLMAYMDTPLAELGMDDMTFTTEVHYFGKTEITELKPGGTSIQVTDENKAEYVNLLACFKMTECIKPYIKAFCDGLWSCISLEALKVFSAEQLGILISGRPDISVKEMQAATKYEGFSADDQTIKWFWELAREMSQQDVAKLLAFMTGALPDCVLHAFGTATKCEGFSADDQTIKWSWERACEMSQQDVAKLLAIMTGSPRVPATGLKAMRSPLVITKASESRMPSAHTCANQLVLSQYTDKSTMRQHIYTALKQPAAFHFR